MFTVEKLTKKFGKKVVLDNITINFKEDTTVIVGLNGSGKTVFLITHDPWEAQIMEACQILTLR